MPSSSTGASLADIAAQFGYRPDALKAMISKFRSAPKRSDSPLFVPDGRGRPAHRPCCEDVNGPDEPPIADRRLLDLTSPLQLRTRVAGVFLFLPLLARLHFEQLVEQADYPGSKMIPAPNALLRC